MKRILITGVSSYVGNFVCDYLKQFPNRYEVKTVGMRDGSWQDTSLSSFDTIFHVAGLAHVDVGKANETIKKKYYSINTDLTIEVAKKAKEQRVKQFIFMSSSIVYGDSAPIGVQKIITRETLCVPTSFYGDSKLQAEKGLQNLQDEDFKVAILRCPMIYGRGSKGNFSTLEKIANKLPLFPKVMNQRSMLYVGNLAEFVRLVIDHEEDGIFWPCNKEYSNTSELVKMIAQQHGKKVILIPGFELALKVFSHMTGYVNKAFGNLTYEEHLGDYQEEYRLFSLERSVRETERNG